MLESAHSGSKAFEFPMTSGGEFIGGGISIFAGTTAGINESWVNDGADERNAFTDGLFVLLFRVESEAEFGVEIFCDDVDITQKLCTFFHWNEDEKVVDIASIVFISEFKFHETVELVEKNVGEKLTSEIANNDATTFGLAEEAFALREVFPFGAITANSDVFHGFVEDDFMPGVFQEIIECGFVGE